MRFTLLLLAGYISFLSVYPIMLRVENAIPPVIEELCMMTCCELNSPMCADEDSCMPDKTCTPTSCCVCGLYCFCGIVQDPFLSPCALEGKMKLAISDSKALISNYQADCFRPPEIG